MLYKVACILKDCHNNNILHKDIKLENFIIDKNDKITLIDFGYSEKIPRDANQPFRCCGTPYYIPPEFILQKPNESKINIYLNIFMEYNFIN